MGGREGRARIANRMKIDKKRAYRGSFSQQIGLHKTFSLK